MFTGSNRDKLAHLVLSRNQPFYGSSITPFPLLGKAFTQAYTAHLNAHLAQTNQFNADDLDQAFELVGRRPEMLRSVIGEIALELGRQAIWVNCCAAAPKCCAPAFGPSSRAPGTP